MSSLCSQRIFIIPGFVAAVVVLIYGIYEITTPGEFSNWSEWSGCSLSCGQGYRARFRPCDNPRPGIFGLDCEGNSKEREKCMLTPCPVDGGLSQWSTYGACSKVCGGGKRTRTRTCTKPSPQYGGKTCAQLGSLEETLTCNINPCPINGGFSDWGAFSDCELLEGKSCGKGKKVRTRTCNKPVPQHGGKNCEGPVKESADCEIACPTTLPTTIINTTIAVSTATQPK